METEFNTRSAGIGSNSLRGSGEPMLASAQEPIVMALLGRAESLVRGNNHSLDRVLAHLVGDATTDNESGAKEAVSPPIVTRLERLLKELEYASSQLKQLQALV